MSLIDEVRWLPGARALLAAARAGGCPTGPNRIVERCPGTASTAPRGAVPVSGVWTGTRLLSLLHVAAGLRRVRVLADVDGAVLAAPDTPDRALRDYLDTGLPPLWLSGRPGRRRIALTGVLDGTDGVLVAVAETSARETTGEVAPGPDSVIEGPPVHLQPVEHLVAALRGDRAGPGGVLLTVPARETGVVREAVLGAGLRIGTWAGEQAQEPDGAAHGW